MENIEIAKVLREYANLLDIKGENRFRIGSYRRAAQTVQSFSQPFIALIEQDKDLTTLPGIGKSMAEHIEEIVRTGTLHALRNLRKDYPSSVGQLVQVEGLGPKRTRQLYEQLGITSIAELQKALVSGKVAALPGFGNKSAAKLRKAVGIFEQGAQRFKLIGADQLVSPLIDHLRQCKEIERLEVAGSYRRRMETVGDIDILVACENAQSVMERFQSFPQVDRVIAAGKTRGTIILGSGLQVDLRIVPSRCYGAALHYFTGSKAHNVAVRKLGVDRGLRISEYGVFRVPKGKKAEDMGVEEGRRVGGAKEEDVFRAVQMDWVPPELREDRGEIDAAQKHKLPVLVTLDDIRGDLHMHSKWSDGRNTIEEMAQACKERGYQYCAITDHSQAVRVAGGLRPADIKKQLKEIASTQKRVDGIVLLAGCEVDVLPDGSLDLPDDLLAELDVVVASVHSQMNMNKSEMTKRVIKAMSHSSVNILGHPTGRQISHREPFAIDLEEVFKAAADHEVAVELDSQPERLDLIDVHAQRAKEMGAAIAIDSDAHSIDQLRFMNYGVGQARRGWLEKKQVINALPWSRFKKWLYRRRPRPS